LGSDRFFKENFFKEIKGCITLLKSAMSNVFTKGNDHVCTKILSTTIFNIDNNKKRFFSIESFLVGQDTEDSKKKYLLN